jgi:hypothetical protein
LFFSHVASEGVEMIGKPHLRCTRHFEAAVEAKPFLRRIDKEGTRVAVRMRFRIRSLLARPPFGSLLDLLLAYVTQFFQSQEANYMD